MIEKFRFYKFDCKMPSANLNFHLRLNELDVYCVKVQCRAIESLRIALDFEKKKNEILENIFSYVFHNRKSSPFIDYS